MSFRVYINSNDKIVSIENFIGQTIKVFDVLTRDTSREITLTKDNFCIKQCENIDIFFDNHCNFNTCSSASSSALKDPNQSLRLPLIRVMSSGGVCVAECSQISVAIQIWSRYTNNHYCVDEWNRSHKWCDSIIGNSDSFYIHLSDLYISQKENTKNVVIKKVHLTEEKKMLLRKLAVYLDPNIEKKFANSIARKNSANNKPKRQYNRKIK